MIEGLKPYPKSKKSGALWLPEIPATWDMRRNGRLFVERNETNAGELPILEVSLRTGVRVRNFDAGSRKQVMEDREKYKRARRGDLAYNMMRMWQGAVGVVPTDGLVSPAYVVARPLPGVLPAYFEYLFRTDAYKRQVNDYSRGIVADRNRLYWDSFKQIPTPFPPPDEQAAIVRFLDHADRQINRYIRAKRKLIALLNEQKQAIIHRAVTRGLDPNVKLKPSGVEWLGDVPEHWGIVRNMSLFMNRVEPGRADFPILQVSLRSGITPESLDQFGRPKKLIADDSKYKFIRKGDLAYNTMRMWQGAIGVSPEDGLVSPAYVVLAPRQSTCSDFYSLVFRSEFYKRQVNRYSTGIVSDRNRLYWESFKAMPNFQLPFDEQVENVRFITKQTASLDASIVVQNSEIELLREFLTRLVADVVTGRLDVRAAASKLPDLTDDQAVGLAYDDEVEDDEFSPGDDPIAEAAE